MHEMIDFPNLGIHLESVGKYVTVFGIDIAYYGITASLGILSIIFVAMMEAKRTGQDQEHYLDLALYTVVFSIIGARLYYVIFSWDMYKDDLLSILRIREGGLAIYGGVIAGITTAVIYAKRKHLSPMLVLDTIAPGLPLGHVFGRMGNFFNREAFGEYTDNLFAMRLPLDAVRKVDVTELMREHLETVDGVSYIQVHPTFLYEAMWCLGLFVLLMAYRKHKRFEGEIILLYLMGYGAGRVWIEGLRTDQLLLPGIGFPVSQLLAGAVVVVTLASVITIRIKMNRNK